MFWEAGDHKSPLEDCCEVKFQVPRNPAAAAFCIRFDPAGGAAPVIWKYPPALFASHVEDKEKASPREAQKTSPPRLKI